MILICPKTYWRKYFCRMREYSSAILPPVPAGTTLAAVPHANGAGPICSHQGVPLADTGPGHTALSWENSPLTSAGLLMCQENARLGLLAGRDAPSLISADLPSGAKVWNATWRNLSSKKLSVTVFPADIVASEILWCFRSHSWLRLGRVEPGPQLNYTTFSLPICAMLITQSEIN